jgi:acetyl coenzyme A synthetase (ADP forming)-like protein
MKLLTEPEGLALLKKYGVPIPAFRLASTQEEAMEHADAIGYPVVVKVVSPAIVHKSDLGGVMVGLTNRDAVRAAWDEMMARISASPYAGTIQGVIVEEQIRPGLEVIVGGKTDPTFGKVLTFGSGGVLVELIKDVVTRVLPLTREEISGMVLSIKAAALMNGYRGGPNLAKDALIDAISTLAKMFQEEEDLVEFDINPIVLTPSGCFAVDARIYQRRGDEELHPVLTRVSRALLSPGALSPRAIAVIGASSDPTKVGYAVMRNLLAFPGTVYPVNPHRATIMGRKVYPDIASLPGPIDMAVIAVPAPLTPTLMQEIGYKGAKVAVVLSAGFRETGQEGAALEDKLVAAAQRAGVRLVGPNCLGIMLPHIGLNTTFDPVSPRPGRIGFISQSGAIITTIVDWSIPEGIGFSAVISVGNQSDLGFTDYLPYLAQDPSTRAIILYIEEITDGTAFMSIAQEVTERVPIIGLKSGSSSMGKQAASSHTGSLAGSYEVYQAAFLQSGVIPVYSLREAFDVAELLSSEGYPRGPRAVVVTTAGGFAVLSSDYAEQYNIEMVPLDDALLAQLDTFLPPLWSHHNPMDLIGDGGADRFARVFDCLLARSEAWDIAFVIAIPSAILDPNQIAQEIVRFTRHTENMVVGCILGGDSMKSGMRFLREHGVPNYGDIEDAFRAVGKLLYARNTIKRTPRGTG